MDQKKVKKTLRISTGACRRLTKDLRYYIKEKNQNYEKLEKLKTSGADKYKLKTQRELLEETCAVLINTHGKLKDSYTKLMNMLATLEEKVDMQGTEEFKAAQKQLEDTKTLLAPKAKGSVKKEGKKRMTVSVFGSSRALPSDASYLTAMEIGENLAKKGFSIMNGGYFGLMEAVSKGASKVENASVSGILVSSVFPSRKQGNEYLTVRIEEKCIENRLATLVGKANAFIILPGSLGTLTELIMAWNSAVLAPLSQKTSPPVIAFKEPWEDIIKAVGSKLSVPKPFMEKVVFVSSAKEAVEQLCNLVASSK